MARDLVLELTLQNKKLQDKLSQSTAQINRFKSRTEKESQSIQKAFSGIASKAGGIGLAIAGVGGSFAAIQKGVQNFIAGSQTTTDAWGTTTTQLNSTLDSFWQNLSNGNGFKNFIKNLENVKAKSKALYAAEDALGTGNIFASKELSDINASLEEQRTIINDKKSSAKEQK